jgi:biopolymer transport protein ExbD
MRTPLPIHKRAFASDDNLVPLINIIFLLLIFFMVAGNITASDVVPVNALQSITQTPQAEADAILLVSANGDVYLNSQPVGPELLTGLLLKQLALSPDPEKFRVQVKVDAALPVEKLKTVMGSVRRAGLLRVSLLTLKGVLP